MTPEDEASAWFSHRAEEAFIELRSQMRVRHFTQQQLADRVTAAYGGERRITEKNISSWFRGFVPALGVIEAYARACGVDAGWLAFGADSNAIREAGPRPEPPNANRIANHLNDKAQEP